MPSTFWCPPLLAGIVGVTYLQLSFVSFCNPSGAFFWHAIGPDRVATVSWRTVAQKDPRRGWSASFFASPLQHRFLPN